MNATETEAWVKSMKANRGHWKVDPVHNGTEASGYSLLLYKTKVNDHTAGEYIFVRKDHVSAGEFAGAIPHMGEALFTAHWDREFASFSDAVETVIERAGMSVLMALILPEGSPYCG